eukprot:1243597-Prymnesium_polylepis.2
MCAVDPTSKVRHVPIAQPAAWYHPPRLFGSALNDSAGDVQRRVRGCIARHSAAPLAAAGDGLPLLRQWAHPSHGCHAPREPPKVEPLAVKVRLVFRQLKHGLLRPRSR